MNDQPHQFTSRMAWSKDQWGDALAALYDFDPESDDANVTLATILARLGLGYIPRVDLVSTEPVTAENCVWIGPEPSPYQAASQGARVVVEHVGLPTGVTASRIQLPDGMSKDIYGQGLQIIDEWQSDAGGEDGVLLIALYRLFAATPTNENARQAEA